MTTQALVHTPPNRKARIPNEENHNIPPPKETSEVNNNSLSNDFTYTEKEVEELKSQLAKAEEELNKAKEDIKQKGRAS